MSVYVDNMSTRAEQSEARPTDSATNLSQAQREWRSREEEESTQKKSMDDALVRIGTLSDLRARVLRLPANDANTRNIRGALGAIIAHLARLDIKITGTQDLDITIVGGIDCVPRLFVPGECEPEENRQVLISHNGVNWFQLRTHPEWLRQNREGNQQGLIWAKWWWFYAPEVPE